MQSELPIRRICSDPFARTDEGALWGCVMVKPMARSNSHATGRRPILKRCSNCGNEFFYSGSHATRNQKFFCCYDCYIESKTKKKAITCDWCGGVFLKKSSDIDRTEHNFCCPECCLSFRHKQGEFAWNHRINGETLHRKVAESKIGRKLFPWDEVHHIDGNHFNNSPANISVMSKSEHAKIHASNKKRGRDGRFIKSLPTS